MSFRKDEWNEWKGYGAQTSICHAAQVTQQIDTAREGKDHFRIKNIWMQPGFR